MGDLRNLGDDELLALAREDAEAFGAFYERHVDFVIAQLTRATGDVEQALDLTAEAFAAALLATRRYRPCGAPARAWLLGIARNKLADARRRGAREQSARRRLGMPEREFSDAELERVERAVDATGGGYTKGLAALPQEQREAVAARVIEERDYAQIAAASGASEATVRQRVSRGLARLARFGESRP